MQLPRSAALAARLEVLPSAGSTNDELLARASGSDPWPHLSVVATDDQTHGRGRFGRTWSAPPGRTLAASVLLRPALPLDALGWIPLITGVAVARALTALGATVRLKWPNDVLIGGRKVCGILTELMPDGSGVVTGLGINLTLTEDELPVPTATSLALEAVETDADTVLAAVLDELTALVDRFIQSGGDAASSGIRDAVLSACDTIGRSVRVELPSGQVLVGTAVGLDGTGRLEVVPEGADPAAPAHVAAGDVTHLRY